MSVLLAVYGVFWGFYGHSDVFSMPLQSGGIFMSLLLALTYGQSLALADG